MRTGLRTEIILSITLLLTAALLFAGFLLVKLSERNLLDQKRAHAADMMVLIAASVEKTLIPESSIDRYQLAVTSVNSLQAVLGTQPDIISWRLVGEDQKTLSSTTYDGTTEFQTISAGALQKGEVVESLNYSSFSWFGSTSEENFLDMSTSLWAGTDPYGLLQIRFSLAELQQRVRGAQRLILIYVIVYGLVLAVFGVYMLNRNIVNPVRLLQQATTKVASGTLAPVNVDSGPGEIHELAGSFNQMVGALAESRAETESHIADLEETNKALERARDDLVRSEKLATVGHLAAGMAHEIGNPLGAVVGYLNILKDDLSGTEKDLVERSLVETARIDRLIRELLDFSTPVDRQIQSFCPVTLLRETVDMLRHQGQLDDIEIDDQCDTDACMASMDRTRLMQVWINLLLNARDAMHGRGLLKFMAERDRDRIRIIIEDQGEGIEPEALKQIFEPFYTTKDPGQGYGLGLAVCQRIVDESHGSIEATSEKGQGARFIVTLPCVTETAS